MRAHRVRFQIVIAAVIICIFVGRSEARRVHLSIPGINITTLAFHIAKEKGYYQIEDLDVQIVHMSAGIALRGLIGGNVEFTAVGGSALPAILRGAPLRYLFSSFYRPQFRLYAKPEIQDIHALKTKKVAVSNVGSGPDSLLRDFLKTRGLDGEKDVVILGLGTQANRFAALMTGAVDAAMLSTPEIFMAEDAGFREIIDFSKTDLVEVQGSIVTSDEIIKLDPPLVRKFTRGTLKGFLYMRDIPSGSVSILAKFMKVPEAIAERDYRSARPSMTADGTIDQSLQKKALEHIVRRVGLKESPSVGTIFDYSLLQNIRAELKTEGWSPKP
jgi:ABC-type nitrate/sulfonate/bicarbonate transport system substrate-binding protein